VRAAGPIGCALPLCSQLLPLALRSARHVGPWLLLAPVAASRLLGPGFRWRPQSRQPSPDNPRFNAVILGLLGGGTLLSIAIAWSLPMSHLGWLPLPSGALVALRACPDALYNHYNEGGYLIWLLPERKVFVDSRQDPYPLSFLLELEKVESGQLPPWAALLRVTVFGVHSSRPTHRRCPL